jgi:Zn ribbon nucleic-acid-binding protein
MRKFILKWKKFGKTNHAKQSRQRIGIAYWEESEEPRFLCVICGHWHWGVDDGRYERERFF